MRTLPYIVACLGLAAFGCRADNSTVLLERDLRLQEDKLWHLQSCLEDAQMAREATIRENEALKQELADTRRAPATAFPADADLQPPSVELPGNDAPSRRREVPNLEPPTIELPEGTDAPQAEGFPDDAATIVNSPPAQLVINKRLTGGLDRDGHGGDEGLLVVFELRDAAGHLAHWPGRVSVVALDPALEGAAARVARWDITPDELPAHYLNTMIGRGLQFELPWPSRPPAHRELVLFVRFTGQDGQKLTSDTKISVRPPGDGEPGFDRQTRRDASEGPGAAEDRVPRSRLKARARTSDTPRATRAPAMTDSAQSSGGDLESEAVEEPVADEQAPLEATRPSRPKWQPFR
jgi:hypothetical protein